MDVTDFGVRLDNGIDGVSGGMLRPSRLGDDGDDGPVF